MSDEAGGPIEAQEPTGAAPQSTGTEPVAAPSAPSEGARDLMGDIRAALASGPRPTHTPEGRATSEQPQALPGQPAPPPADEVLAALEVDQAWLDELPPEQQALGKQLMADLGQKWYHEKWVPLATQMAEYHQSLTAHTAQINAITQSEVWPLAAELATNPELLEQVQAFLRGEYGQPGQAAPPAAPELNVEGLDDETKAVYGQLSGQVQALRQQYEQELAALRQQYESDAAQRWQREEAERVQRAEQLTGQAVNRVLGDIQRELGFDPRSYGAQYREATKLATRMLQGELYEWMAGGRQGPPPKVDIGALLRSAFQQAGFNAIAAKRRKQQEQPPPPPDRAGATEGLDLMRDVRQARLAGATNGRN